MQTQATHAEPTTMFNETEPASRWKISVRTLQDGRRRKTGPRFVKLQGWAVRYPLQAVIDFEERSLRGSADIHQPGFTAILRGVR